MSDHHTIPWERVSGIELAEIRTLMLVKKIRDEELQRVLKTNGVETLEQLDWLTARNLLYYLRSL
jgi:hypothetical protein